MLAPTSQGLFEMMRERLNEWVEAFLQDMRDNVPNLPVPGGSPAAPAPAPRRAVSPSPQAMAAAPRAGAPRASPSPARRTSFPGDLSLMDAAVAAAQQAGVAQAGRAPGSAGGANTPPPRPKQGWPSPINSPKGAGGGSAPPPAASTGMGRASGGYAAIHAARVSGGGNSPGREGGPGQRSRSPGSAPPDLQKPLPSGVQGRDLSMTVALKAVGQQAKKDSALSERVEAWRERFR